MQESGGKGRGTAEGLARNRGCGGGKSRCAEDAANILSWIAPDLSRAVDMATPRVPIGPETTYAGRGNPHAWLKSGADWTISHGIILGAPRFSPHRMLGSLPIPRTCPPLTSWILAPSSWLLHRISRRLSRKPLVRSPVLCFGVCLRVFYQMAAENIRIVGARQHNLKGVNVEFPREKLVVITGMSGSGKSSLPFYTFYPPVQPRSVKALPPLSPQFTPT